jgi:hypothetical protein
LIYQTIIWRDFLINPYMCTVYLVLVFWKLFKSKFELPPAAWEFLSLTFSCSLIFFFCGGTRVPTQGFILAKQGLAKQALYHLSHTSSPFCPGYFGDGVLRTTYPGWPWTVSLPISASRIIGVNHWNSACPLIFEQPGLWVVESERISEDSGAGRLTLRRLLRVSWVSRRQDLRNFDTHNTATEIGTLAWPLLLSDPHTTSGVTSCSSNDLCKKCSV